MIDKTIFMFEVCKAQAEQIKSFNQFNFSSIFSCFHLTIYIQMDIQNI